MTTSLGGGRFTLRGRLGSGAFGVVYEAHDEELDQVVALKKLHQMDAAAIYAFKKEFRSLAEIRHPNLAYLYELFSEDAGWFFTMELVEGYSLLEYLTLPRSAPRSDAAVLPSISESEPRRTMGNADTVVNPPVSRGEFSAVAALAILRGDPAGATGEGPVTRSVAVIKPLLPPGYVDRLLAVMDQICAGVAALHDEGLLHRDLKPSNVRVTPTGEVKILDFGLVTESAFQQSQAGGLVGTPLYMSPEQALATYTVGPASDWYSVGTMLYEALVGEPPFSSSPTLLALLQAKQMQQPEPPSQLVDGVPTELDRLCVGLLEQDPSERPTHQRIVRSLAPLSRSPLEAEPTPSAPRPRSLPSEFAGRVKELGMLREAFDVVQDSGEPVACFIHGLSGVGKTTLLEKFISTLSPEPVLLLTGRCYQQESVAYKAWDMVMDVLSKHLKRLPVVEQTRFLPRFAPSLMRIFPVLGQVQGLDGLAETTERTLAAHEIRRRAFSAFRELMARLSAQHRLVVVLDDLQWSDVDSVELIGELLRCPDAPRLLLLGTYRSDEVDTSLPLQRLLALHEENPQISAPRMLPVDVLPFEDTRSLVEQLLAQGDRSKEQAELIARESGGNPMFVRELVCAQDLGDDLPSRPQLDDVIRKRVAALPDNPRALLEAVALAGEPIKPALAERAAELSEVQRLAGELLAEKFVRVRTTIRGETIEPYHARIRECIVEGLSDERAKGLHARLADVLEAAGAADAEALAVHFFGSGDSDKGWRYTRLAADEAMSTLAFERAGRLYRKLLDDSSPGAEESVALQRLLADALSNAGHYDEAIGHFDAVLRHHHQATPRGKVGFALTAIWSLIVMLYRLYLYPGHRRPSSAQTDMLEVRHQAALSLVYVDPPRMFVESLVLQKQLSGLDVNRIPAGSEMWCFVSAVMSFSGFSFSFARRILQRFLAGSDDPGASDLLDYRLSDLVLRLAAGQWSDIVELDDDWIDQNLDSGRYWHVSTYLLYFGLYLMGQDRHERVEQCIAKLHEIAHEYGYQNVAGAYARFLGVNLLVRTRRLAPSDAVIASGLEFHVKIGMEGPQILFHAARARQHAMEGRIDDGEEAIARAEEIVADQSPVPPHYTAVFCLARVELALLRLEEALASGERGSIQRTRDAAATAVREALRNGDKYAFTKAETLALAGRYHGVLRQHGRARKYFRRAIREAQQLRSPLDEARARLGLARLILESSEDRSDESLAEAEGLIEAAQGAFEDLDCPWDLDQAAALRDELR